MGDRLIARQYLRIMLQVSDPGSPVFSTSAGLFCQTGRLAVLKTATVRRWCSMTMTR